MSAPTANARGHFDGPAGYLYATVSAHLGLVHTKLGSTSSADPVATLRQRYDCSFGRTRILWILPTAHRFRDERQRLHVFFDALRIYPDRELFDFSALVDEPAFLEEMRDFEALLMQHTADEEDAKPAPIASLDEPNGLYVAAPDRRTKRTRAEWKAENDERRVVREQTKRTVEDGLLGQVIEDSCDVDEHLIVDAIAFNALARSHGAKNVATGMASMGHPLKNRRIDGRLVRHYVGLGFRPDN